MKNREVIDVQLESFFGNKFPQKIQRLVDEELNQGRWVDGYDLAVRQGVIEGDAARQLLEVVLTQHPELRIDEAALRTVVEERLPQSLGAAVSWIVDDSGSYALTDSLRVARFKGASIVWRSPRISFDGIDFDSLSEGNLRGRAWLLGSHESPDAPFVFDFETGELLEGHVVEHE
jgi:hypothetical protein